MLLRAFDHRSLNEANITQIVMSAGSMVAGGLAFTIPGIWMLGLADHTSMAETLTATTSRSGTGKKLFLSMGVAGVYSVLSDVLGVVPQMLLALPIPGVTFGIYNSPIMLSVGFLVGFGALAFAMAGAVFANFGLVVVGTAAGLWDMATAGGIVKSLGMGLMMGSGLGVVLKDILPALVRMARGRGAVRAGSGEGSAPLPQARTPAPLPQARTPAPLRPARGATSSPDSAAATTPACSPSWWPRPRSSSAWGSASARSWPSSSSCCRSWPPS